MASLAPLPFTTSARPFLADGGLETTLLFKKGLSLPLFASFPLLDDPASYKTMSDCYAEYIKLAVQHKTGIVLESSTWRSSLPWIRKLGYPDSKVGETSSRAVDMLKELRKEYETEDTKVVISGCLGPLGDAYKTTSATEERDDFTRQLDAALASYRPQVDAFATSGVDLVSVMTVSLLPEAVAAVLLAKEHRLPIWVSPTLETNGRLRDGSTLAQFIEAVDRHTSSYAAYYGINCAHPTHFIAMLKELPEDELWVKGRIWEVRANASEKSHDELDECEDLDRGDPRELGSLYRELMGLLPSLRVLGGCCGTDEEHICEIAKVVLR
ncbi:Methionine synthase [Zalerion maritima]|uniref:Methionine synthase n=1 Tax=Zalerion maritima TaxID=339359 RepID=A0AAD5RXW2_9PEZI|nr:Methionine synthase [Zalerion maritima]